jgi:hypothetical protein
MQEAEANLKQAAVDFLAAAAAVTNSATASAADPLDAVDTGLPDLGELEPAITPEALEQLKADLADERLLPTTIVELVALARQVAAALLVL